MSATVLASLILYVSNHEQYLFSVLLDTYDILAILI